MHLVFHQRISATFSHLIHPLSLQFCYLIFFGVWQNTKQFVHAISSERAKTISKEMSAAHKCLK